MSDADASNVAAAAKKRLRREARIRENYDRISAALSVNDSKANRNPTRIIPDVPGFQILSKAEVKRDTKEIEKNSNFAQPKERNLVEEMEGMVQRSMRPQCAAESSLMRKKRRLVNWVNNPEIVEKDMLQARQALQKAKNGHLQLEADQEQWLETFQHARRLLVGGLKMSIDQNRRLKAEGQQLLNLCDAECGYALRKKRTFHAKDLVDELQKRHAAHEHVVAEYTGLAQELDRVAGQGAAPIVRLSLEEVHYPEDDAFIRNNYCRASSAMAVKDASVSTAAGVSLAEDKLHVVKDALVVGDAELGHDGVRVKLEDEGPGPTAPAVVEEPEQRECLYDIPLPYFDHETKETIPVPTACASQDLDQVELGADTASGAGAGDPAQAGGPRTRKRSGSLSGTIKLEASHPSATDLETGNSSEAPSSVERAEHGNWSPAAAGRGSRLLTEQDLLQLLHSTQEAVKLSEGMVADAEFMFQERVAPIDDATLIENVLRRRTGKPGSVGGEAEDRGKTKIKIEGTDNDVDVSVRGTNRAQGTPRPSSEGARAQAAPFLALSRAHEHDWSAYIDALFDALLSQGIVTRKGKKKGPEFLPVSVDPRLRTPREVSLVLSPLSQFEDRMVGVLHRDTIYQARMASDGETAFTSTVCVPVYLRTAEEEALERLRLQSSAARADVTIQRLRNSLKEMAKYAGEAQCALKKAEQHHEVATLEEAQDLRRMYKELVHYGIVSASADDPPMSPITSNSASIAASVLQGSVYHGNGGGNKSGGSKNSRAPVRTGSVSQQQQQASQRAAQAAASSSASAAVSELPVPVPHVSRADSAGSESGTTTSECLSSNSSDGKASEEAANATAPAPAAVVMEVAEASKRKASSAGVSTSAPKRRR